MFCSDWVRIEVYKQLMKNSIIILGFDTNIL